MRYFSTQYKILIAICLLPLAFLPAAVLSQELTAENVQPDDAGTPPSEIYVDKFIDEESLAKQMEAERKREGGIAPHWAPGNLGVTYRYYTYDTNLHSAIQEHGAELRWHQGTFEHGTYEFQIEGLTSEGYDDFREPDGYRIQLRQNNYVINSKLQLDSDVIHYRSAIPSLVEESYRFRLPSTILQGMSNRIYHNNTTLFLNFGEIGRYIGTAAKTYNETEGNLAGLGAQHILNRNWNVAFQFWNTDNTEQVEPHQSLAGAVEYKPNSLGQIHQMHVLGDSLGETGMWYDGRIQVGRWMHRAGVQYLPPGLLWTDVPINSDYQGIYWRGDRNAYRWLWNFGSEISQNNIDDDAQIPGYISTATFASLTWKYRRRTHFGGNANVHSNTADSGTAVHNTYRYTLRAFADHQSPIGKTRIEPELAIEDTYFEQNQKYGLRWIQEYNLFLNHKLNSDIQYYTSDQGEDDLNLKLYFEHQYPWGLRLNGYLQEYYVYLPKVGVSQGTSISLGLGWQFFTNWLMSLNADYNIGDFEPEDGEEFKIEGTKVLFSINYNIDTGKRRDLYGVNTGDPGRGRVVGRVFLDENRNGNFDLGERALSNIIVYLDGRHSTETGPKGGFEFWPVAAGKHSLTMALVDVPLPWGLTDEDPQRIDVLNRGETELNFALIRLNE